MVAQGGCAAAMRSSQAWRAHPQGAAAAAEPLIAWDSTSEPNASLNPWQPTPTRPLAGVRVLDLTRVLAGPVATRFLAGFGAQVLRIDPPDWDEPSLAPEVTVGKRCARLDLRHASGRHRFEALLADADMLVHGYRADALDKLGLGAAQRRALQPQLIDISLNAYGHTGPWNHRRGFDSLVQMSCGIAHAGMVASDAAQPKPLPFQALDHATGYLMAAAAVRGLRQRMVHGGGSRARLSLARVAAVLMDGPEGDPTTLLRATASADFAPATEHTPWGPAQRLLPAFTVQGAPHHWTTPACNLGSAQTIWL